MQPLSAPKPPQLPSCFKATPPCSRMPQRAHSTPLPPSLPNKRNDFLYKAPTLACGAPCWRTLAWQQKADKTAAKLNMELSQRTRLWSRKVEDDWPRVTQRCLCNPGAHTPPKHCTGAEPDWVLGSAGAGKRPPKTVQSGGKNRTLWFTIKRLFFSINLPWLLLLYILTLACCIAGVLWLYSWKNKSSKI